MHGGCAAPAWSARHERGSDRRDAAPAVEAGLIALTLILLGVLLLLPLVVVFMEAFARGLGPVLRTLERSRTPSTRSG